MILFLAIIALALIAILAGVIYILRQIRRYDWMAQLNQKSKVFD
jgi:hypothetical protein